MATKSEMATKSSTTSAATSITTTTDTPVSVTKSHEDDQLEMQIHKTDELSAKLHAFTIRAKDLAKSFDQYYVKWLKESSDEQKDIERRKGKSDMCDLLFVSSVTEALNFLCQYKYSRRWPWMGGPFNIRDEIADKLGFARRRLGELESRKYWYGC